MDSLLEGWSFFMYSKNVSHLNLAVRAWWRKIHSLCFPSSVVRDLRADDSDDRLNRRKRILDAAREKRRKHTENIISKGIEATSKGSSARGCFFVFCHGEKCNKLMCNEGFFALAMCIQDGKRVKVFFYLMQCANCWVLFSELLKVNACTAQHSN